MSYVFKLNLHIHVWPSCPQSLFQGLCEWLVWVRWTVSGSASCYRFNTDSIKHRPRRTGVWVCESVWALFPGAIRKGWWSWELRSVWTIHPSFPAVHKVPLSRLKAADHQRSAEAQRARGTGYSRCAALKYVHLLPSNEMKNTSHNPVCVCVSHSSSSSKSVKYCMSSAWKLHETAV